MVKFLIHRPIAVIMTFIAILLLGGVAAGLLPVSLMPDIDIPEITVQVNYSGKSVQEIESVVVRKLRQNLMQVPHLDDLSSESHEGKGIMELCDLSKNVVVKRIEQLPQVAMVDITGQKEGF